MKWIILGLLLSASCALAERTVTAYADGEQQELCCLKNKESVTINKKDRRAFINCGLLKKHKDRFNCANYYVSPWGHHFENARHDI